MAATRRLKQLTDEVLERLDSPPGAKTVALSGGADSAALAFLLVARGEQFDTLHIHHGYPASDRLAGAARSMAEQLDRPFESIEVEVGAGPSPEERARVARYQVFDRWPRPLLTAHTLDDNAETILINLIRGSGADGLSGIPRHRPPTTWRPMLDVTRSETREIATLAGLGFVDDPMNDDPTLTRNRVRRHVLPVLRDLNPRVDQALARGGEAIGRDSSFLDSLTPFTGTRIATSIVLTLPRPMADRALRRMLDAADVGVTSDRLERMWAVARGHADRHDLAAGRSVVRRGAILSIE